MFLPNQKPPTPFCSISIEKCPYTQSYAFVLQFTFLDRKPLSHPSFFLKSVKICMKITIMCTLL